MHGVAAVRCAGARHMPSKAALAAGCSLIGHYRLHSTQPRHRELDSDARYLDSDARYIDNQSRYIVM